MRVPVREMKEENKIERLKNSTVTSNFNEKCIKVRVK